MKKLFKAGKDQFRELQNQIDRRPPPLQPPPQFQQQQQQQQQQQPVPTGIQPLSAADLFRYRYHHGVNLGSVYVLEKWLSGSMFEGAGDGQSSELEAVKKSVERIGIDATREKWENHWRNAIEEKDWNWLTNVAHCTTIRLPIGYYSLGPEFSRGTPFEPYAAVYANCWPSIKQLVQTAATKGIGILIDIHAIPGGANAQEHSGTNSGKAEFWGHKDHQRLLLNCLQFTAVQICQEQLTNVVGLQVCNEAEGWAPDKGMYQFYDSAIATVGSIDSTLPVYISDAWNLDGGLDYSSKKNTLESLGVCPVVVDTHVYFCFSDADKAKSPQQIISEVSGTLSALDRKAGSVVDRGASEAIIGEYSCVLDGSTWEKCGGANREELVKQVGRAKSNRFQQRAGGAFFWTLKMDWMPGGEWGFVAMTDQGAITAPAYLAISHQQSNQAADHAGSMRDDLERTAYESHLNYWNQHPGDYQHERYQDGWRLGWGDADGFWRGQMGPQRIGMVDLWTLKRCREYSGGDKLKSLWEWEQGFRRGVEDFEKAVGARN